MRQCCECQRWLSGPGVPGDLFSVVLFVIGSCQLGFRCLVTSFQHKTIFVLFKWNQKWRLCVGCGKQPLISPPDSWVCPTTCAWGLRPCDNVTAVRPDQSHGLWLVNWAQNSPDWMIEPFPISSWPPRVICVNNEKISSLQTNYSYCRSCFTKEFPVG